MWNYCTTKITNYLPVIFAVLMIAFSAFCWSKVLDTSYDDKPGLKEQLAEVSAQSPSTKSKEVMVLIGFFVVLSQYLSSK